MSGTSPFQQSGAVLVTAMALLLLLTLLALGDLEEVRHQIRLALAEQERWEFMQFAAQRLEAEERALAVATPPGAPCSPEDFAGSACGDAPLFLEEEQGLRAAEDCRLDPAWPLPWQESAAWPAAPSSGALPALRSIVEFRCFLPPAPGLSSVSLPLYRVTVLAALGNIRLGLQSLWSPRGRHAFRYLLP